MKQPSERKILVIYTGGTIGMKRKHADGGYTPDSLDNMKKNIPELNDLEYQIDWEEMKTKDEKGKEIFIDSSQATTETFNEIGKRIKASYNKYDGFVVVYGSDTMAYAAGALSYMLEGLDKPVMFTGSMDMAIDRDREKTEEEIRKYRIKKEHEKRGSDGPRNLVDAIHITAQSGNELPHIPEVGIVFNGRLMRGNSTEKFKASNRDAFYWNEHTQIELAKIRHGESETEIEEKGLPTNFSSECEVTMLEEPIESGEDLKISELKNLIINDVDVCDPGMKFIFPDSDAIFLFNTPKEEGMGFDSDLISKIETERGGAPVFYFGGKPPVEHWIRVNSWNEKQARVKIHYILNKTSGIEEMKMMAEGNLRGEGEGPLLRESEILNESRSEIHNGARK